LSRKARIEMIDRDRPKLSVSRQCKLVGVSRSSLYYRPVGSDHEDLNTMAKMDGQYLQTPFYGSRRMRVWLRSQGHNVNRKRVRRLMRLMGLDTVYRRPNTSKASPEHRTYPYLLRGLHVIRANQVWVADITYIPMARGFVYLVAIMDHFSRHVLSWRLSNTLDVDFCVEALEEALSKAKPDIFNTDQGSQFTSDVFTNMLLEQGIQISMDGKGRYLDNIFVERLWRTVKYEEVYLRAYEGVREARARIEAYMNFYNNERPHQALGYRTPAQVYHEAPDQLSDTAAADSLNRALSLSN
jgi:putative transposase